MHLPRSLRCLRKLCLVAWLGAFALVCHGAHASEYHGQVTFSGLPVPGVTVVATQGTKKLVALTDQDGAYSFPDLPDGSWKISVEMQCFAPLNQDVTITKDTAAGKWEMKLLPLDQILAQTKIIKPEVKQAPIAATVVATQKSEAAKPGAAPAAEAPKPAEEPGQQPSDGLLINGSVNNAATSQYTLAPAFGNQRSGTKGLYTGGAGLIFENSSFDARPYSLSGANTPKTNYNQVTATLNLGGPIHIPHLLPRGPNFFLGYQWTRDNNDSLATGIVPTAAQIATVPTGSIESALLSFYPQANVANPLYNYQIPILSGVHQDSLQSRLDKTIGKKDQFYGGFAFQSSRSNTANLFGFVDHSGVLGMNTNVNWNHRFSNRLFLTTGYRSSRRRTEVTPYVERFGNFAAAHSITGTDQTPSNWGPPSLVFSSGITPLSDATSSFNRNRTEALSESLAWYRTHHNFTFGGDFRRQEFNANSQQNPRGTYTFISTPGGTTDFAHFAAGIPDATAISFGNADKYLRQSIYDAYFSDDWRILPELTINAGLRWEYGAPITELKNRLANLAATPGFVSVTQVRADQLSGSQYPTSLVRPDKLGIEPRIGISWRPIPGSSLVVRAGYGVYDDTSVYQATALALAQQPPFSSSVSASSATCPVTLATGFSQCPSSDTFAVDPNFRVGYAQTWQLSAQRDLPYALQMTATYNGVKGTRGVQEFLPNTYPIGAANPCPQCPTNFTYRASNGNSTREAGSLQLRRRLRGGFTASALYTYSKSIDDDAVLGGQGPVASGATSQSTASANIAQNWLNLSGERALSTFDQRHLLNVTLQYTSGQGLGGGTLMSGWRGRALKEWTVQGQIVAGTGLPETPTYLAVVPGTGISGTIRGSLTGAPIYVTSPGRFLNGAAYTAPATGQWGNAPRDSITGPGTFTFNSQLARTFRLTKRFNLDMRAEATNILNHVVYNSYVTTINSSQFGAPAATNAMRSLQFTSRVRF